MHLKFPTISTSELFQQDLLCVRDSVGPDFPFLIFSHLSIDVVDNSLLRRKVWKHSNMALETRGRILRCDKLLSVSDFGFILLFKKFFSSSFIEL